MQTQTRLLFKFRIQMIDLKGNLKSSNKGNLQCDLCEEENSVENQTHLLQCKFFLNHPELKLRLTALSMKIFFKEEVIVRKGSGQ